MRFQLEKAAHGERSQRACPPGSFFPLLLPGFYKRGAGKQTRSFQSLYPVTGSELRNQLAKASRDCSQTASLEQKHLLCVAAGAAGQADSRRWLSVAASRHLPHLPGSPKSLRPGSWRTRRMQPAFALHGTAAKPCSFGSPEGAMAGPRARIPGKGPGPSHPTPTAVQPL